MIKNKVYLSVGAQFKNEAHILTEWLNHYIKQGVQHFILMNDNSTDGFIKNKYLQHLIKKRIVTLINLSKKNKGQIYNLQNILIPYAQKCTKWLIVCDLDEFVYTPTHNFLGKALIKYERFDSIFIFWKIFLTSNNNSQPKSVINSNIMSIGYETDIFNNISGISGGFGKSIYNLSRNIHNITIHGREIKNKFLITNKNNDFELNHYKYQSREFMIKIKGPRGGGVKKNKYKEITNLIIKNNKIPTDYLLLKFYYNGKKIIKDNELKNLYSGQ